MSLQERDWYREGEGRRWTLGAIPAKWLIVGLTTAAFVVQAAVENGSGDGERFLRVHLGLSMDGLLRGEAWQALSYVLLHDGLGHLFWNMIALYVFATVLEDRLTGAEILRLYVLGGIGGAAGHALWALAGLPGGNHVVVGASGAVTALLVDAVLRAPSAPILLLFFPVPLWIVGILFVGMDAVQAIGKISAIAAADHVAVQAHLGGAATAGLLWLLRRGRGGARSGGPARRRARREEFDAANVLAPRPPAGPTEEERVDALLERIHAEGMGALSDEERAFLRRVSERYRGRRG